MLYLCVHHTTPPAQITVFEKNRLTPSNKDTCSPRPKASKGQRKGTFAQRVAVHGLPTPYNLPPLLCKGETLSSNVRCGFGFFFFFFSCKNIVTRQPVRKREYWTGEGDVETLLFACRVRLLSHSSHPPPRSFCDDLSNVLCGIFFMISSSA